MIYWGALIFENIVAILILFVVVLESENNFLIYLSLVFFKKRCNFSEEINEFQ